MNIALIDIAATTGGAASILNDILYYIRRDSEASKHTWYVFTSLLDIEESDNIKNIKYPNLKRSWLARMQWEYTKLSKILKTLDVDIVVSLQNNGLPVKAVKQVIFFHNLLLVPPSFNFNLKDVSERKKWVITKLLGAYIRWSWRYADGLIVQGKRVKELSARFFPEDKIMICHCWGKLPSEDGLLLEGDKSRKSFNNLTKVNGIKGYIYPSGAAYYKGHEIICEAVKLLESRGHDLDIVFTISGDENTYSQRIKELSANAKSIRLVGGMLRQDIEHILDTHGIIMTSHVESCGLPIVEGITAGTVVVAEDRPYVREIVSGYDYPRLHLGDGTVESLAAAMLTGLEDHVVLDMNEHYNSINKDIVNNGYIKLIHYICSDIRVIE